MSVQHETLNYRARIAVLLPALQLAYFVLIWPLVYARGIQTADLVTAPVETQTFLLNRLFFPAMAGIAIVLLVAERHRLAHFRLGAGLLVAAFLAYLGASFVWALAPGTSMSKFALLAMQIIALVPAVLLAPRTEDIIRPMFWVIAVTVFVNILAILALPPTPLGHAGIYSHKNTLGAMMALSGFFAFYGITRSNYRLRLVGFLMLPLVLIALYVSQSKTSLGLFLMVPALAWIAILARRYARISLPILLAIIALPAAVILSGAIPGFSIEDVSTLIGGDATFTGRTVLWDFSIAHIADRPLQGYGYQSFWDIGSAGPASKMPDGFLQRTPHAHNGYLDLLLQGGVIAMAMFTLLLAMVCYWIDRVTDEDAGLGYFITAVMVYLLLLNLLETVWMKNLSELSTLTMLFILLAALAPRRRTRP
jgi:exopolysaccharide production protein ExoQ